MSGEECQRGAGWGWGARIAKCALLDWGIRACESPAPSRPWPLSLQILLRVLLPWSTCSAGTDEAWSANWRRGARGGPGGRGRRRSIRVLPEAACRRRSTRSGARLGAVLDSEQPLDSERRLPGRTAVRARRAVLGTRTMLPGDLVRPTDARVPRRTGRKPDSEPAGQPEAHGPASRCRFRTRAARAPPLLPTWAGRPTACSGRPAADPGARRLASGGYLGAALRVPPPAGPSPSAVTGSLAAPRAPRRRVAGESGGDPAWGGPGDGLLANRRKGTAGRRGPESGGRSCVPVSQGLYRVTLIF